MRSKTWERASRIILSSLLKSDLTMTEIKEIGRAFANQSNFSEGLGYLIKDLAKSIDSSIPMGKVKPLMSDYESHDDDFSRVMWIIKKRRVPKREIVPILRALRPEMKDCFEETNRTVREMVDSFFKGASKRAVSEFIHWLDKGISASDPYLRGIMQKKVR